MLIIGLVLTLYAGSTIATDLGSSGTNAPIDEAEIVKQIKEIFNSFNDGAIIDTLTPTKANHMIDEAIQENASLQNYNPKRLVSDEMSKLSYLKEIIEGTIQGRCQRNDLERRLQAAIIQFKTEPNLYEYIKKLNVEHANYCLTNFAKDVSKAIDDRITPSKEMLDNMDDFRQYYETKQSTETTTGRSQPIPDVASFDTFTVKTVLEYLGNKYPFQILPDERVEQHEMRFAKQLEHFIGNPPSAFCEPIINALDQDFSLKFEDLKQLNPKLDSKMDKVTHNWLSVFTICKRLKYIGPSTLYHAYLSLNYDIHQLEQKLLENNADMRRYLASETLQNLEILRALYNRLAGAVERIEHLYELLLASHIDDRDCVTRKIASLISLYREQSDHPNLEIYMREQVRRQLKLCKPILEKNIRISSFGIYFYKLAKINQFRNIFEKTLDKSQSSPIKELWQSKGPEKVKLFNQAMTDYVTSIIGSEFDSLQNLREKVSAKLTSVCQEVKEILSPFYEQFEQISEFDTDFEVPTNNWMSSYAICDYYIGDSFDWESIFDHLKVQKKEKSHFNFGNLFGASRKL